MSRWTRGRQGQYSLMNHDSFLPFTFISVWILPGQLQELLSRQNTLPGPSRLVVHSGLVLHDRSSSASPSGPVLRDWSFRTAPLDPVLQDQSWMISEAPPPGFLTCRQEEVGAHAPHPPAHRLTDRRTDRQAKSQQSQTALRPGLTSAEPLPAPR